MEVISTKINQKAVLLHIYNKCASIQVTYFMYYENLEMFLAAIKYSEHEWVLQI